MMILFFIAYAIVGVGAGIMGGLLGMSGGIITVPCLILLFNLQGFASASLMQLAIGTSLAAMVFNTISSMWAHNSKKMINWILVKRMLPGLILGCVTGALVGDFLPGIILQLIFGLFATGLGLYFYRYRSIQEVMGPSTLPNTKVLNGLGFGVGAISNILGIGGSTMTIPLFVKLKVPMQSAIASSTATGLMISFIGAVSYLLLGLGEPYYETSIGYIYLPAFAILAVTTFVSAPLGVRLAYRLATPQLKKIFSICLIGVGILMLLR